MSRLIGYVVAAFVSGYFAHLDSDQSTLRDCATKGQATMYGGGSIKCEVLKETTK